MFAKLHPRCVMATVSPADRGRCAQELRSRHNGKRRDDGQGRKRSWRAEISTSGHSSCAFCTMLLQAVSSLRCCGEEKVGSARHEMAATAASTDWRVRCKDDITALASQLRVCVCCAEHPDLSECTRHLRIRTSDLGERSSRTGARFLPPTPAAAPACRAHLARDRARPAPEGYLACSETASMRAVYLHKLGHERCIRRW